MGNWSLRRAGPNDAQAFAACIDAAYADLSTRIADLPPVSQGIDDDIGNNLVWVAETNSGVVGGMVLIRKPDHLILANIAVSPDMVGTGIGKTLLARAEAEARALGVAELLLATHTAIPENVALYSHLGWQETGRSGNKVHMSRQIDRSTG